MAGLLSLMLLAVPLAPLIGAGLFGKTLGRRGSHVVTILGVFVAFVISAMALKAVALDGWRYNATVYEWLNVGGLRIEVGFLVDGLTAMMMCVAAYYSFGCDTWGKVDFLLRVRLASAN